MKMNALRSGVIGLILSGLAWGQVAASVPTRWGKLKLTNLSITSSGLQGEVENATYSEWGAVVLELTAETDCGRRLITATVAESLKLNERRSFIDSAQKLAVDGRLCAFIGVFHVMIQKDTSSLTAKEDQWRISERQESRDAEDKLIAKCHALFARTSAKKVSDVTITESRQIQGCDALSYYK